MKKTFMILSAVGKDRPGIVDEVSAFLFDRGANIEDSRMSLMGGQFVIMMLFSGPSEYIAAIKNEVIQLKNIGLKASL